LAHGANFPNLDGSEFFFIVCASKTGSSQIDFSCLHAAMNKGPASQKNECAELAREDTDSISAL
jgi:hypothetical protein